MYSVRNVLMLIIAALFTLPLTFQSSHARTLADNAFSTNTGRWQIVNADGVVIYDSGRISKNSRDHLVVNLRNKDKIEYSNFECIGKPTGRWQIVNADGVVIYDSN